MNTAPLLRPKPDVVARRIDDAGVLVDLHTNKIFEVNRTGIRLWELLADGLASDAVLDTVMQEFDIDRTSAERELTTFVADLRASGLLE